MSMLQRLKEMITKTSQESWAKVNSNESTIPEVTTTSIASTKNSIEESFIVKNQKQVINKHESIIKDDSNIEDKLDTKDNLQEKNNETTNSERISSSDLKNDLQQINISNFVYTESVTKTVKKEPSTKKTIIDKNPYETIYQDRIYFPDWNAFPCFFFELYKRPKDKKMYGPFKEADMIARERTLAEENNTPAKKVRMLLEKNIHRLIIDEITLNIFLSKEECKQRFRLRYPLLLKVDRNISLRNQIRIGKKVRYSPRRQYVINGEVYLLTNDIFYYNEELLESFFGMGINTFDAMNEFMLSDLLIGEIDVSYKKEPKKKQKSSRYMGNNQDHGM